MIVMRTDWVILAIILLILGWASYAIITTAYSYSLIEPESKQCRDEFGHVKPCGGSDER